MRHVCKDMSQGINPELSDEVREGKKKKKGKKAKENAVAYFQTDVAQPGQQWHKNSLHIQSSVTENKSSVGFI